MKTIELPLIFNQVILESPRLLLKELSPDIMIYLFANYSDDELKVYLGLTDEGLAIEKYKVKNGLTTHQTSMKNFLMLDKTNGRLIGKCGFHNWYAKHSRAEMGYLIINEEDKGKGYMREAARTIVAYGFEYLQLNRIEAMIGTDNKASLALIHRLGFTEEGILREHHFVPPVMHDSVCFSLLKREYDLLKDSWI